MSNYCACSGGDEEYIIKLNQQGPPGPKGDKGDTGFSPTISVLTSTDSQYILNIINENDSFNTPNLYGDIEKLNADLSNIPNPAIINGISLANIEGNISSIGLNRSLITTETNGNLVLTTNSKDEESTVSFNYQVVANPKEQRLELHDNEGNVKIVATTDYIPTINVATTEAAGIVKPDGSTITVGADGTISAVGGDVTAAGDNRFTGDNTFIGKVNIAGGALTVEGLATLNQATAQYLNAVSITSSGEINATSIKANGLRSDDIQTTENKKYLTELDVDNQTIQMVNGKLHANIDELGNEVNNLSDRVTTLQTSKQDTLTAGANITIVDNVISAIGGGGGGVSIDDSTISSATTWSSSKINSEITTVANTKNDNIFDIGRFTVVGSPTITDDGVVSEFSSSSYLIIDGEVETGSNFEIIVKAKTGSDVQTSRMIIGARIPKDGAFNLGIYQGKLYCSSNALYFPQIQGAVVQPNTEYYFKAGIKDNILYAGISSDGLTYDVTNGTLTTYPPHLNLLIGLSNGSAYAWQNQIDLKNFSITVDEEVVFSGLMESTKPIYDKITSTNTALSTFQTDTDNNFSAVNSALNEKANLSDLAGYVPLTKYNELLARVVALETEINGGNA